MFKPRVFLLEASPPSPKRRQKENNKKIEVKKLATRKFKILLVIMMLVTIIALVCAVGLVWIDIQQKKADLDHLYWVEEHTHSGPTGMLIKWAEAELRKRQTVLTSLIVTIALVIIVLIVGVWYKIMVRRSENGMDQQRGGVTVGGCHLSSSVNTLFGRSSMRICL